MPNGLFTVYYLCHLLVLDLLLNSLVAFRGEDITEDEIKRVEPIVNDEGFTVENMKSKSAAAANLCSWVISIYTYNRIYVKVPLSLRSLQRVRPGYGGFVVGIVIVGVVAASLALGSFQRVSPASVAGITYCWGLCNVLIVMVFGTCPPSLCRQ